MERLGLGSMSEQDKIINPQGVNVPLEGVLSVVKDELEDHLSAINENTDEIQCNNDLMNQLNNKIIKLAERVDMLQTIITQTVEPQKTFDVSPLTKKEKALFQALYAIAHEKESVTYEDLARRCGVTTALAVHYITNLIEKGVPVWKKYIGKTVHLTIDPDFVLEQAQENIVGVTIPLTHWI